ncbi:ribbon-helix-helix domain-containing protein [Candidatus Bathyarchaeota archaeon]|nr:ribbon-helix-helix domain-containing protein [Candidatus Bathyarchaeota archaeon]
MTKIDFELEGELAEKLECYVSRGLYSSKPEVIRDALRHLFQNLEKIDLINARTKMIEI